jgi:transposase-like protein
MKQIKRKFDREFKLKTCEEIETGIKTQAQVVREYSIAPNLVSRWIKEYRQNPMGCFFGKSKYQVDTQKIKIKELEAALGRATYENQILKEANVFLKKVSQERRFTK